MLCVEGDLAGERPTATREKALEIALEESENKVGGIEIMMRMVGVGGFQWKWIW